MKTVLELFRKYTDVKVLVGLFLVSSAASTALTVEAVLDWLGRREEVSGVSVAVVPTGTPAPTPTKPTTPTPIPNPPTATPIVNPYDFGGVRFDLVSEEEITNGVAFSNTDPRIVAFQFTFQDGSYFVIKLLLIRYFEWMEDLNTFCVAGSYKGCVYSDGVHLTIKVHSGCLGGQPLAAESLRVRLEDWGMCGFAAPLTSEEEKERIKNLKDSSVTLFSGFGEVPLFVEWIEHVPKEKVEEFSRDFNPGYLLSLMETEDWKPDPDERYLILRTSGRERGCEPEYSCDRWLIVLRKE